MNILSINFEQLYRRHLCRHGHFGINILHLIAVAGIYVPIFALCDKLLQWLDVANRLPVLLVLTAPWFAMVAANVPLRVAMLTAVFVGVLVAIFDVLPPLPIWVWILMILAMHRFQQFSHRLYNMDRDMSEFEATYPKGFRRFVLLLVYELPILLNYLAFGHKDWEFRSNVGNELSGHRT
ncbi:MAG: hypothetical protein R3C59_24760 [Planctomycetaceae bacterium]